MLDKYSNYQMSSLYRVIRPDFIYIRPQRPTKKNFLVKVKISVHFWGLGIWVSSTSFWKSNIGWPQQPPIERVQISVKIWIFDDPFHKNGPLLVTFLPGSIQPSGAVICLMKWGCKGHWGHGGCWGCRGHWGCRGSKVWKITTED